MEHQHESEWRMALKVAELAPNTGMVPVKGCALLAAQAEIERLRTALLDANQICRSAWSISNRIATEYSTNEMGTYFGAFSERTHESLKRQHEVILATGGYPRPDGA